MTKAKKYVVFNYTDGILASPDTHNFKGAKQFIKDFRARFKEQGYYRTSRGDKLNPEHIDLEVIPFDELNPELKVFIREQPEEA